MSELTKEERAKIVAELMRSVWLSLESHLDWANKEELEPPGDGEFHKSCVIEYARQLELLTLLY